LKKNKHAKETKYDWNILKDYSNQNANFQRKKSRGHPP